MKIRGKWKPFSKLPFDFHEKNNGVDLDKSKIDDRLRGGSVLDNRVVFGYHSGQVYFSPSQLIGMGQVLGKEWVL